MNEADWWYQLLTNENKLDLYLSVGALEDSTWAVDPVKKLTQEFQNKEIRGLDFKSRIFSHLDHMDVSILTFTKGLQELRAAK